MQQTNGSERASQRKIARAYQADAESDNVDETVLVLASPSAEGRQGWLRALGDGYAVCEVAERRGLQQVLVHLKPEVLIVDLELPGLGRVRGLRAIRRLSPPTKVIALAKSPSNEEGVLALKTGASGYCSRSIDPEELAKAVTAVRKGEIWASRGLVCLLVAELVVLVDATAAGQPDESSIDTRLLRLTQRQRIVAEMTIHGASNKEIGNRLNISERTVKAHLTAVFRNLGVSNRLHLAVLVQGNTAGARQQQV